MLVNTTPESPVNFPGTDTYKMVKYIVLNPSSWKPGKVFIACICYKDDDDFANGTSCGDFAVDPIDFNLNDAGLLDAIEAATIALLPTFQSCGYPPETE